MKSSLLPKNTGRGFEQHVLQLVKQIIVVTFGKKYSDVKYSYDVRLAGKASKAYQIDILGEFKNDLFLIECKDFKGVLDYKVVAAYIYKCIDISNQFPDKTVYAVIIDKAGFNAGAIDVKYKPNDIWSAPKIDFNKQIKLLRVAPRTFDNTVVVYEYEDTGINYYPLLLSEYANSPIDELVFYLKNGGDLATRISTGLRLLSRIESDLKYKQETREELKILSYENISNAFLHIREYYDSSYFSDRIKHSLKNTKSATPFYESELLSAMANYKRIETESNKHSRKPGLKWIAGLNRLQNKAANLSTVQKVSIKLFLGMWLARFDDYALGIRYIQESKEKASLKDFPDNRWHYFVSLLRLGELHRDEDVALKAIEEAELSVDNLCAKHRAVGKDFLAKIVKQSR